MIFHQWLPLSSLSSQCLFAFLIRQELVKQDFLNTLKQSGLKQSLEIAEIFIKFPSLREASIVNLLPMILEIVEHIGGEKIEQVDVLLSAIKLQENLKENLNHL